MRFAPAIILIIAHARVPAGFGCVLFDTEIWFLMSWNRQLGVSHQSGESSILAVPPLFHTRTHTAVCSALHRPANAAVLPLFLVFEPSNLPTSAASSCSDHNEGFTAVRDTFDSPCAARSQIT